MGGNPEMTAPHVGLLLFGDRNKAIFNALSDRQKGYFVHWVRSNPGWNYYRKGAVAKLARKVREQRP